MKLKDNYVLCKFEWDMYHNFKPSIFQRIFWLFLPTETYIKWLRYRNVGEKIVSKPLIKRIVGILPTSNNTASLSLKRTGVAGTLCAKNRIFNL